MAAKYYIPIAVAAVLLVLPAGKVYYEYSGGTGCARCHEIQPSYDKWRSSTHRNIPCTACHGGSLTSDWRRVVAHLRGQEAERIHVKHTDLYPVVERCQKCHQQEFAQWKSGPHSTTYARLFTDPKHNTKPEKIQAALVALSKRIVVRFEDAA